MSSAADSIDPNERKRERYGRPLAEVHPFDPAVLERPWSYYRRLLREAPVYRDPKTGLAFVSSHALVLDVLRQPELFSNRFARALGGAGRAGGAVDEVMKEGYPPVDTMLTADPPEHKRFRGLVNKAFTPRRVKVLEPAVEKLAIELLDAFAADGHVEVLSQFSVPLPLTVIAEQLGVPRADLPRFKRWTDGFLTQLSGMASPEDEVHAAQRIVEFQRYFAERLEEARESPRDDIISDLVRARLEGERSLDLPESLSILQQLLVAGNETTASAIAEGLLLLVENPDQMALLRDDPERIGNAIEEVLRLASPTQNMWRLVTRDCELGGEKLAADSILMLHFGAANRDPAVFEDPDRFDVLRPNAADQLAFGHGIHFCLGAMLARKEMSVAFRSLLARLENLRLAPGAKPVHKPHVLLRGLRELQLEFDPA